MRYKDTVMVYELMQKQAKQSAGGQDQPLCDEGCTAWRSNWGLLDCIYTAVAAAVACSCCCARSRLTPPHLRPLLVYIQPVPPSFFIFHTWMTQPNTNLTFLFFTGLLFRKPFTISYRHKRSQYFKKFYL